MCNNLEEPFQSIQQLLLRVLPSPKKVSEVLEGNKGLFNYFKKNQLWIEMSTTDENEMIRLSNSLLKKRSENH